MSSVSHQTIKLSKGKHVSPDDGACVMELASMLAGNEFSDHPESVSPVIGGFLRAYNDWIDDDRRQDLYAYASKVVGSRGDDAVEQTRADRLAAWAMHMRERPWRRLLPSWLRSLSGERSPSRDVLGAYAVRSISRPSDESHRAALTLIDELLEIRSRDQAATSPATPQPSTSRRYAGLTTFVDGDRFWWPGRGEIRTSGGHGTGERGARSGGQNPSGRHGLPPAPRAKTVPPPGEPRSRQRRGL